MLSRLSARAGLALAQAGGASWLAPALLACRGYATRVSKTLLFDQHGAPEQVLRLEEQTLPVELADHEVLLHLLAVSPPPFPSLPAAHFWFVPHFIYESCHVGQ